MDSSMNDQQHKDYISSFFPSVDLDQLQNGLDLNGMQQALLHAQQNPSQGMNSAPQLDMNMLGNLMSMHGLDSPHQMATSPSSQHQFQSSATPSASQMMMEQHFKLTQLQQLQQLQNQIFQQQIALISGQSTSNADTPMQEPIPDAPGNHFHGLPTPGSSTELRAQQQPLEYVSPMVLNYLDPPRADEYNEAMTPMPQSMNSHYQIQPRGVASAPAHIAFRTTSSADVDVDISPLTSPWLGAQQHHTSYPQRNKRTASSSGDESSSKPSRKKQSQSPAIRPYNATPAPKRTTRTTKSTTSTPLLRSTQRPRHGSLIGNDVVGDSPSPVDLSMPPPASTSSHTISTPPTDNTFSSPSLTPVTPASIMNLGRLGVSATNNLASRSQDRVGKAAPNGSVTRTKSARRGSVGTSPALKPLLPAGSAPAPIRNASSAQPVVQVRKTSHKAAEQKRRDSLKTTFDDLRGLLPPIPLPSDGRNHDEPMLPGALPPRGPPKAGSDGPNKAVSKLQLLMCGNDYIRQLKGRVERRDDEIHKLRNEVQRLRDVIHTSAPNIIEDGEPIDLTRDLDEIELLTAGFGRGASIGLDEDGDEYGDVDD